MNEIRSTIVKITNLPVGHRINMQYSPVDGKPEVFMDSNDKVVGYIWYDICDEVMTIEMIEMIEKGEGNGTEAINFLFSTFPIKEIFGSVLEDGMRAYWFWESLGAEMSLPVEEIEHNIVTDCSFTLYRPKHLKGDAA
ncbi:hypothetical protein QTG56_24310 (plasmid) [Rossellomorea sp. AcN35-11]|nr:hypothetical protein [Rossellomorea aquimaris]WJV31764.1 hypothetical protein QTG56_24310 [Rossellomorea sp. AcN35-11]